jgi:hypothetical protein
MALPLLGLMALGIGVSGGMQFLGHRADERKADSMLDDFVPQFTGPDAHILNAQYQNMAQQIGDASPGFLSEPGGKSQAAQSFLDQYQNDMVRSQLGQAQMQREMQDAYSQTNRGIADQLDQDYNRDLRTFAETQNQFRSAMQALENPSNINSVATLYNFFNILEPGGRVTENEDGTFAAAGSAGNRWASWLNEMRGGGLTEVSRKEIVDAIWAQYGTRWEQANRQKRQYEQELRDIEASGRKVTSPIGRLGIDWSMNQLGGLEGPPRTTKGPPLPPGYREVEDK